MTDEELAEKYFDEECPHSYADNREQLEEDVIQAFLAGLKAGRPQWHDLRKDPNDLPNAHCMNWVIAIYDNGTLWCRARREEFVEGIFWVNSYHYQIFNVIAWKEIVLPELPTEPSKKWVDNYEDYQNASNDITFSQYPIYRGK